MSSEVAVFITRILCQNLGCLDRGQLYSSVRQRYNITNEEFYNILSDKSRFIAPDNATKGTNAEVSAEVIAKTSVRVCQDLEDDCDDCGCLHLCRYFVCGQCRNGTKCKYPHALDSSHNSKILKREGLENLDPKELFPLLMQNDGYLLPDICSHYNTGRGKHGNCRFKEDCSNLHVCKFFLQEDCMFGRTCQRAHKFNLRSWAILKRRGLGSLNERMLCRIYKNRLAIASDMEKAAQSWLSESSSSTKTLIEADKNKICLFNLLGRCRFNGKCRHLHYFLPYRWQILDSDDVTWKDHSNMEHVEKAYSNPENDISEGLSPVDFVTMTCGSAEVRRLSSVSSVTKHSTYILTTTWLWYWKDSQGQWRQYGCEEEENCVASSTSQTLEKRYLDDINGRVSISVDSQKFIINFKDMTQQNLKDQTKTEVRRRPIFISTSDVKRMQDSWNKPWPTPGQAIDLQLTSSKKLNPMLNADTPSHPVLLVPPQQTFFPLLWRFQHPHLLPYQLAATRRLDHRSHSLYPARIGSPGQLGAAPPTTSSYLVRCNLHTQ